MGRSLTPLYSSSLAFNKVSHSTVKTRLYLGPLRVNSVESLHHGVDQMMNFGWKIIQPISKIVLWFLVFMHTSLNLNYGIVLIIFAFIIRIITGPLIKKSYESSQKMQKVQPQVKAVQVKYKSDPQKMNREVMALYKKHGVNPLGGCLPILIQMPLLFALFTVFRITIEFRGASFFWWIKDLSQPDAVFTLPFSIPLYGESVCILPLFMGATMFLQQKSSMATMDKAQRLPMYFMSFFFLLLFNTFPSGLNLYYSVSNILNIIQQRSIRKNTLKKKSR